MLHEEVIVDWQSLERQINDPKLLESLQMDFLYGVSQTNTNFELNERCQ